MTNCYTDEKYDIISLIDTLDLSSLDEYHKSILKIFFSDVQRLDQTLLCSDDYKAEEFLKNQGVKQGKKDTYIIYLFRCYLFPPPKNIDGMTKRFREILTLQEKKLTSTYGDLQSQYSAIHQGVSVLTQKQGPDVLFLLFNSLKNVNLT